METEKLGKSEGVTHARRPTINQSIRKRIKQQFN